MQVIPRLVQVERRCAEVRTPGLPWPDTRRIAIVRDDRLGDLVLSLPAVHALRRGYPGARLALMVRPSLAPLARCVPDVDEVLEALPGIAVRARALREFRADAVVCISRGAASVVAAFLSRAGERVGAGYRLYSPLLTRSVREHRRIGGRHELEYAMSFAHRAGAPAGPETFPIAIPPEQRSAVRRWLDLRSVRGRPVVLHPGSGGSCPAWPPSHFVRLAELLVERSLEVVVSIGPDDAGLQPVLDAAPEKVCALPRFSGDLVETAALLGRASAVVSNSTGPLHLAAALGAPTLGFFAPWSSCGPVRWGPYAPNGLALVADIEGDVRWTRRRRRRHAGAMMAALAPQQALDAVMRLVEEPLPTGPAAAAEAEAEAT